MLGGVDPVLIFQTAALGRSPLASLSGVPILGNALPTLSLPVPIYLSEKGTGIYVESESVSADVATDVTYTPDGDLNANQQAIGSSLTITLVAKRSAPLLSVLLAFMDSCLTLVTAKKYAVTYVNGPISVFNGLIESFSQNADRNTDLIRMTLVLARNKKKATYQNEAISAHAPSLGITDIPNPTGGLVAS